MFKIFEFSNQTIFQNQLPNPFFDSFSSLNLLEKALRASLYPRTIKVLPFLIVCLLSTVPFLGGCSPQVASEKKTPNVLFIPIDDLRPELGCYGNDIIKTPNIDKLAKQGVVFTRAYCQQALCNPSRASLLTGLRPDTIQVWDLDTKFRDNVPDVVTLPQFFKQQGYTTIGFGKIFHNIFPDAKSWTEKPKIDGFPFDPDAVYAGPKNLATQERKKQALIAQGKSRVDQYGHWYLKADATEMPDVDDDVYYDGAQTTLAIKKLQNLAKQDKPFFLAVGYYKPHLPFNAPKKYWDLYDREQLPLAKNQFVPGGSPVYAVHGDQELRNYDDCHDLPKPSENPWDLKRQREMIHGYYACVSYIDAQVGRLMDELERLGLKDNTIVVLWGDHGYKLGEHNSWCKMSNYEIDNRVPMIFSGAGIKAKGRQSNALTEFVDIYPTLCEMADFEIPETLEGSSLTPLLEKPNKKWKNAAFSQYLLGRFGPPEMRKHERMGYTIRTDQYRYVEWYSWDKENKKPSQLLSRELFDHTTDPMENKNLADNLGYKKLIKKLSNQIKANFKSIE